MDIKVEDLTSVDKKITITADRADLKPKVDEALKKYSKQINMPGFRPGKVPISIVRKRFGKEIETEQVNEYVQEVFRDKIVPEYEPVGEPQIDDFKWEDGQLEVDMKIGVKPELELADISTIEIDKMVHDVTEDEVEEEVERALERAGTYEEADEPVTETSKVLVDAVALDDQDNPIADDVDEDKELDLNKEENQQFKDALVGKKAGEIVPVELGEGDDKQKFNVTLKQVYKLKKPELNEDFVKQATQGQVETVDAFRADIKSRIQNYYDQTAEDMAKQELMEKLIESHEFEVPEVVVEKFLDAYVDQLKQQQGDLPEDFNTDEYKEGMRDQAKREAKWAFILDKLEAEYEVEIEAEDVDNKIATEAARYGMPVEMVKNFYQQSNDQLENLRRNIRTDKVFQQLLDVVSVTELDKDSYQEKKKEEQDKQQETTSDEDSNSDQ